METTVAEAERFYLEVDFSENGAVKELGARWDNRTKGWYVHAEDKLKFKNWWPMLKEVAEEALPFGWESLESLSSVLFG